MSARPVVSTTNCASTSPSTFADGACRDSAGAGLPGHGDDLLLDLELEVRLVVVDGGAVPPTTPLAIPPATPLPEKSASSVTFLERSMSGSTSGILIGAVSTWNPFGGGGAHDHVRRRLRLLPSAVAARPSSLRRSRPSPPSASRACSSALHVAVHRGRDDHTRGDEAPRGSRPRAAASWLGFEQVVEHVSLA